MPTGDLTSQPIGHLEFCKRFPRECAIRSVDPEPERMTDAFRMRLAAVSLAVNKAVRPMSDSDIFGKDEYWTYPKNTGDCEDYVLLKRRILMQEGTPASNLLITVVRQRNGEGHAVLTVRTDRGDFILDNLNDDVRPWDETGYLYLKRQASEHTGRWIAIREGQEQHVAAVK
nr:transglutaminase-like cysteine peptidase [Mesorhizobium delmotii]